MIKCVLPGHKGKATVCSSCDLEDRQKMRALGIELAWAKDKMERLEKKIEEAARKAVLEVAEFVENPVTQANYSSGGSPAILAGWIRDLFLDRKVSLYTMHELKCPAFSQGGAPCTCKPMAVTDQDSPDKPV